MILRARTSVIYVENRYATEHTYPTTTRLDTLTLDVARFLEIKNDFARRTSVTYVGIFRLLQLRRTGLLS
jgi:hypothetical protein